MELISLGSESILLDSEKHSCASLRLITIERDSIDLAYSVRVQDSGASRLLDFRSRIYEVLGDYNRKNIQEQVRDLKEALEALSRDYLESKHIIFGAVAEALSHHQESSRATSRSFAEAHDQLRLAESKAEHLRLEVEEMAEQKIQDRYASRAEKNELKGELHSVYRLLKGLYQREEVLISRIAETCEARNRLE